MKITEHQLQSAQQLPSPNCSERPVDEISLLVIHNISLPPGEFGGPYISELFCNQLDCSQHEYFAGLKELKVSSHLLIRRDGALVQYVPFNMMAWHAGISSFEGREACNEFSIGIELEGSDYEKFTDEQYDRLIAVSRLLLKSYPELDPQRIVGHSDIAPERKTDPGPFFDWARYLSALQA